MLALLRKAATAHSITIFRFQNVGNHLHLLIKTRRRSRPEAKRDLQRFLKQFAGEVAFRVTEAIQGEPKSYWEKLVYSRIVSCGRDYTRVSAYFLKNFLEAESSEARGSGQEQACTPPPTVRTKRPSR